MGKEAKINIPRQPLSKEARRPEGELLFVYRAPITLGLIGDEEE